MDQKNKWTLALKKLLVESLVAEVPLKVQMPDFISLNNFKNPGLNTIPYIQLQNAT